MDFAQMRTGRKRRHEVASSSEDTLAPTSSTTATSPSLAPSERKRPKSKVSITSPSSLDTPESRPIKKEPVENPTETKSTKPKPEITNPLYDDIVFLRVGAPRTRFGIHRGLLTKHSTLFSTLLSPHPRTPLSPTLPHISITHESDTLTLHLADQNPTVFARVHQWLYSGKFLSQGEEWKAIPWPHLISVYLFATEYGISRLHNKVIDGSIQKVLTGGLFPSQGTMTALYRLDDKVTPLRKVLVKLFAEKCDLRSAIASNGSYPTRFLNGLVVEMYDMQKREAEEDVDVWGTRKGWYVFGEENPICVD
ncbi:hypothetical protein ACLMJK_005721 [Lecanora helva]